MVLDHPRLSVRSTLLFTAWQIAVILYMAGWYECTIIHMFTYVLHTMQGLHPSADYIAACIQLF